MSAALQLAPQVDPDLSFMEWREEVARLVHCMGLASQLAHVEESEWQADFEEGLDVADAVIAQADRLV